MIIKRYFAKILSQASFALYLAFFCRTNNELEVTLNKMTKNDGTSKATMDGKQFTSLSKYLPE